jgi:hypothetical protein
MTTAFPAGSGDDHDDPAADHSAGGSAENESVAGPVDPMVTDAEIDRRFADIISGISDEMQWDATGRKPTDDSFSAASAASTVTDDPVDTAEQRRQRREQRRAERAAEVAEYAADQAAKESAYADDEEHFVPAEPPPLQKPRLRTVLATLMILAGLFLLVGPDFLAVSPNNVLVLSVALVLAGGTLLILGLRRPHGDYGDDGSRV